MLNSFLLIRSFFDDLWLDSVISDNEILEKRIEEFIELPISKIRTFINEISGDPPLHSFLKWMLCRTKCDSIHVSTLNRLLRMTHLKIRNSSGMTPLHVIADLADANVALSETIFSHLMKFIDTFPLHCRDDSGNTFVHILARTLTRCQMEKPLYLLRKLLQSEQGLYLCKTTNDNWQTVLHISCSGSSQVLKEVISGYSSHKLLESTNEAEDVFGRTPIYYLHSNNALSEDQSVDILSDAIGMDVLRLIQVENYEKFEAIVGTGRMSKQNLRHALLALIREFKKRIKMEDASDTSEITYAMVEDVTRRIICLSSACGIDATYYIDFFPEFRFKQMMFEMFERAPCMWEYKTKRHADTVESLMEKRCTLLELDRGRYLVNLDSGIEDGDVFVGVGRGGDGRWRERAIRRISKSRYRKQCREAYEIVREANLDYTVKIHDILEEGRFVYVVTDLLESNLSNHNFHSNMDFVNAVHSVILGLNTMHEHGIVHTNLCADKILFTTRDRVLLTGNFIIGSKNVAFGGTDSNGRPKNPCEREDFHSLGKAFSSGLRLLNEPLRTYGGALQRDLVDKLVSRLEHVENHIFFWKELEQINFVKSLSDIKHNSRFDYKIESSCGNKVDMPLFPMEYKFGENKKEIWNWKMLVREIRNQVVHSRDIQIMPILREYGAVIVFAFYYAVQDPTILEHDVVRSLLKYRFEY